MTTKELAEAGCYSFEGILNFNGNWCLRELYPFWKGKTEWQRKLFHTGCVLWRAFTYPSPY